MKSIIQDWQKGVELLGLLDHVIRETAEVIRAAEGQDREDVLNEPAWAAQEALERHIGSPYALGQLYQEAIEWHLGRGPEMIRRFNREGLANFIGERAKQYLLGELLSQPS